MAVDDAIIDSQRIRKETPQRNNVRENVNDTSETLISDMPKIVYGACTTLETTKSALEKTTLATALESKVTLAVRTIRNKIQVTIFLVIC